MAKRRFFLSIIIFSFVGAILLVLHLHQPSAGSIADLNGNTEPYWIEQMQSHGANKAKDLFIRSVLYHDLSYSRTHREAHEFGGALFSVLGKNGFNACIGEFQYGCFHELVGRTIAQNGLAAVNELNQICMDGSDAFDTGICQHGLGHGIQAYFGYGRENLEESLAVCSSLEGNDPIGGCTGGIYMEYNFQTMLGDEADIRKSENTLEPCDSLPEKLQNACVFWQPEWWWRSHFDAVIDDSNIKEMGDLCRSTKELNEAFINTCFQGIGNFLILTKNDSGVERASHVCNLSAAGNELHKRTCLRQAINSLISQGVVSKDSSICGSLVEVDRKRCLETVNSI